METVGGAGKRWEVLLFHLSDFPKVFISPWPLAIPLIPLWLMVWGERNWIRVAHLFSHSFTRNQETHSPQETPALGRTSCPKGYRGGPTYSCSTSGPAPPVTACISLMWGLGIMNTTVTHIQAMFSRATCTSTHIDILVFACFISLSVSQSVLNAGRGKQGYHF